MDDSKRQDIKNKLKEVERAIIKSGAEPCKQIAEYILSEDPIYIPDIDGARSTIRKLDRDDILAEIISDYLK